MDSPRLTVGFPFWNDKKGLWFTIQDLAKSNPDTLRFCDLVVVNDSPGTPDSDWLNNNYSGWIKDQGWNSIRIFNQPKTLGPAQAKNRVFHESQTEWTLCMDCHVLLTEPEILEQVINFTSKVEGATTDYPDHSHPWPEDLFSGPIIYDNLKHVDTELAPIWRGDAWGTWHHDKRGADPNNPPYEIWDQGKGLILARAEDWLGFHPATLGFGGEEGCLAERYRKHGRKVWCVPFLRWNHFFNDDKDVKYEIGRYRKVRNFVIEFLDLADFFTPVTTPSILPRPNTALHHGVDPFLSPENSYTPPSLDSIHRHMVSLDIPEGESIAQHLQMEHSVDPAQMNGKTTAELEEMHKLFKITQAEWDHLLQDPIGNTVSPLTQLVNLGNQDFVGMLAEVLPIEKDLNKHLHTLRLLTKDSPRVVDITRRAESTLALISSRPRHMHTIVYGSEVANPLYDKIMAVANSTKQPFVLTKNAAWQEPKFEECDLLFFKCDHNYHDMARDLEKWHPLLLGRVIIHDTYNHAHKWVDGDQGVGLAPGIQEFLRNHPEWFIMSHSDEQYGLTVLSKNLADRPEQPVVPWSPGYGPGTELHKILSSFGVTQQPGCDCKAKEDQMDKWGVDGCRKNYETIVQWMREGSERWGYGAALRAAASHPIAALKLATKINWIDPFPGLVTESIRRASVTELL
jgi:hypothetical protein